ncbi:MAG: hypothetical protein K9M45_13460, partial [Kiritimatiellales bacterium]|nr:hypothetical protein [Kiritimatiellales bacterium]
MIRVHRKPLEQSTLLSAWGWLLCITVSMGVVLERNVPGLWIVAYSALLSGTYLVGVVAYRHAEGWSNPFGLFGFIGVCLLSYLFTWADFWKEIGWNYSRTGWQYQEWGLGMDVTVTMILLAAWAIGIVRGFRQPSLQTRAVTLFPLVSALCFLLGAGYDTAPMVMALIFNGFLLFLSVLLIVQGCCTLRLRKLNGGMFLLSMLLVTRFFDADFGFFARGVVFIVLGICFLGANLIMARRKKEAHA